MAHTNALVALHMDEAEDVFWKIPKPNRLDCQDQEVADSDHIFLSYDQHTAVDSCV